MQKAEFNYIITKFTRLNKYVGLDNSQTCWIKESSGKNYPLFLPNKILINNKKCNLEKKLNKE